MKASNRPQSFSNALEQLAGLHGATFLGCPQGATSTAGHEILQSQTSKASSFANSPTSIPGSLPELREVDDRKEKDDVLDAAPSQLDPRDVHIAQLMQALCTLTDLYRAETRRQDRHSWSGGAGLAFEEAQCEPLKDAAQDQSAASEDGHASSYHDALEGYDSEDCPSIHLDNSMRYTPAIKPSSPVVAASPKVSFQEVPSNIPPVPITPTKPLKSAMRALKVDTSLVEEQEAAPIFACTYRPRAATRVSPRSTPFLEQLREDALQEIANTQAKDDPLQKRNSVHYDGDVRWKGLPRSSGDAEGVQKETHRLSLTSHQLTLPPRQSSSALTQVSFTRESIAQRHDAESLREDLITNFPDICDAPYTIMFDTNGDPLPPLKHEETGEQEKRERGKAMMIETCALQKHTLLKSAVVIESRTVMWKRVEAPSSNHKEVRRRSSIWNLAGRKSKRDSTLAEGTSPIIASKLPPLPDAWGVELEHSDIEVLSKRKKSSITFQLSKTCLLAQCPRCEGSRSEVCRTCKGCEPDDCFWCDASGLRKNGGRVPCGPCKGIGRLPCASCDGNLRQKCLTCQGSGEGHFAAILRVNLRLVRFTPQAVREEAFASENDLRSHALRQTWYGIHNLLRTSAEKQKKEFRPLSASCTILTSFSSIVSVQVPQAIKVRKKVSRLNLRQQSKTAVENDLSKALKDARTKVRCFILPSDPDLRPVELSERECQEKVRSINLQQTNAAVSRKEHDWQSSTLLQQHASPLLARMLPSRPVSIFSQISTTPGAEDEDSHLEQHYFAPRVRKACNSTSGL